MVMRYPSFPRSSVLVLGSNSIQTLLPATLISQAEDLLLSHRIDDAVALADSHRERLRAKVIVDVDEADELRYVYQRIGFQCLSETLFEDAGRHLFDGDLDPRVFISYYPDLRGSLFSPADDVPLFAGVAEHMPSEASIDTIIAANLVRNYSPHLPPNTRTAPPTVELHNILGLAARDVLEVYLRKWRTRRMSSPSPSPSPSGSSSHGSPKEKSTGINAAVDTVLAKLYTQSEKILELRTLISEQNAIVLSELEPVLISSSQFNILCELYQQRGEDEKLLGAWSKLVDGEWADKEVTDPLGRMFAFLSEKEKCERSVVQHWSIWMAKRDPDRALQLLISLGSKRSKPEEDRMILQRLQEVSPTAGVLFLEYLVLQRHSIDPELHNMLAVTCIDELLACVDDEQTSKLWRAKASSYASSRNDTPFLSYFASTTPDSPSKHIRLRTSLFLQGSSLFDAQAARERLIPYTKMLKLELAIIEGKLGHHRESLSILVHDLRDATSAEAYCTLGGEVVPDRIAQVLGERYNLQEWASLLVPPAVGKTKAAAAGLKRQKTIDERLKKELIEVLLEVYMSGGEATADRTAQLLNAQAMNLDVLDVVALVPPEWPLRLLSSFLARSFRRTLHARHEGQIVKALTASENQAVVERTWHVLREQGAVIEEAADDDEDEAEPADEKADGLGLSFDEKTDRLRGFGMDRDIVDIDITGSPDS